ncbi:hypothetical protein AB0B45_10940 [Nonomuraea sp. NPDC049152]|uniref:hypothetical protein n=1 Tax=Nonomuraea sp. NPDC049152 TaxID=3154350 RepID=UPI0033D06BA1
MTTATQAYNYVAPSTLVNGRLGSPTSDCFTKTPRLYGLTADSAASTACELEPTGMPVGTARAGYDLADAALEVAR